MSIDQILDRCRRAEVRKVHAANHHGMKMLLSEDNGIVLRDDDKDWTELKALAAAVNDALKPMIAALLLCCLASCTGPARILSTHDVPFHGSPLTSPPTSCVAIDADKLDAPAPFEALRIWGHRSKFWPADTTLKVRFLDGPGYQQERAWKRFQTIDALCGITFVRVPAGPSDIRVSFRPGAGHWSYLGTDCRSIPQHAATMNLGLTRWDSSTEWDRVALHEILHALGFSHELQHPHEQIAWDRPAVYAYYARTQGWGREQVDRQVLNRDNGADFHGSSFEAQSIMCYPVPREHVTDARYAAGWNVRMTDTDKRVLKEVYP